MFMWYIYTGTCFSRWYNGYYSRHWTKVRGLKRSRERWILRAKKIRSKASFGGDVNPPAPRVRHVFTC